MISTSFKLYIPHSMYMDPSITDYEILTYAALQRYKLLEEDGDFPISPDMLLYTICHSFDVKRKFRLEVCEALGTLLDKGLVQGEKLNGGRYIIHSFSEYEKFAVIQFQELRKIIDSDFLHKPALFRYFCFACGSLSGNIKVAGQKNVVGNQSLQWFADNLKVTQHTIQSYNETLETLQLLYIVHSNTQYHTNIYGRYEDRELIDQYTHNQNGNKDRATISANSLRSISQRYNRFCRKPDSFTGDERELLYAQCRGYNARMDELQLTQPGHDYLDRKKDLSVFCNT